MSRHWQNPPARSAWPCSVVEDAGVRREPRPTLRGLEGHTTQEELSPLKVVYWNVAGVKASEIDTFLEQLDADLRWDVLVLLEFSHSRHELFFSRALDALGT